MPDCAGHAGSQWTTVPPQHTAIKALRQPYTPATDLPVAWASAAHQAMHPQACVAPAALQLLPSYAACCPQQAFIAVTGDPVNMTVAGRGLPGGQADRSCMWGVWHSWPLLQRCVNNFISPMLLPQQQRYPKARDCSTWGRPQSGGSAHDHTVVATHRCPSSHAGTGGPPGATRQAPGTVDMVRWQAPGGAHRRGRS